MTLMWAYIGTTTLVWLVKSNKSIKITSILKIVGDSSASPIYIIYCGE